MKFGVFLPNGSNGYIMSKNSPQFSPTFKHIVEIRVRTHYSHQMTAAAKLMAPMKFLMLRSKRVAMRRQSLKRQNMRSTTLRCL
jgi:hypothetical protein